MNFYWRDVQVGTYSGTSLLCFKHFCFCLIVKLSYSVLSLAALLPLISKIFNRKQSIC